MVLTLVSRSNSFEFLGQLHVSQCVSSQRCVVHEAAAESKGMARLRLAEVVLLLCALWALFLHLRNQRRLRRRLDSSGRTSVAGTRVAQSPLAQLARTAPSAGLPMKHERLGHVVSVKFTDAKAADCFAGASAEAFAKSFVPKVHVVLLDADGVQGELRRPTHRVLACDDAAALAAASNCADRGAQCIEKAVKGETAPSAVPPLREASATLSAADARALGRSHTFTTHVENGVRYSFDAQRVMFCSGNTTERMHFGTMVRAPQELVVDMFAGIGYFTVPLAKNGGVRSIVAIEKNPESVKFLCFNAAQNRVAAKITVLCGDNRSAGDEVVGQCDRVLMGYIPDCREFIPRATAFLRRHPSSAVPHGIIHYHFLADKAAGYSVAHGHFIAALGDDAIEHFHIRAVRVVKSYSPKRWHCVADVVFGDKMVS
jgi:tRNA wybutosine-synthesizing protein 2